MVKLDFLSIKSLNTTNEKLDEVVDRLELIQKLLELLLTPPDLKEYEKWKLTKRKGI
ncbi:MAG: hypothetical protein H8D92_00045 [Pelagibacteraceae bacterium]|nr:hypothetical protein [Pelagibacteraceae bacterium]